MMRRGYRGCCCCCWLAFPPSFPPSSFSWWEEVDVTDVWCVTVGGRSRRRGKTDEGEGTGEEGLEGGREGGGCSLLLFVVNLLLLLLLSLSLLGIMLLLFVCAQTDVPRASRPLRKRANNIKVLCEENAGVPLGSSLPLSLPPSRPTLRSYTRWMRRLKKMLGITTYREEGRDGGGKGRGKRMVRARNART